MIICLCKVKAGFAFISTPAVVPFIFGAATKYQNHMTSFLYSTSPLIVDLKAGVHSPMAILYNLFVFSLKISSRSMYRFVRISHIFMLIFDSSSILVR